jgi:hypothetical protein
MEWQGKTNGMAFETHSSGKIKRLVFPLRRAEKRRVDSFLLPKNYPLSTFNYQLSAVT